MMKLVHFYIVIAFLISCSSQKKPEETSNCKEKKSTGKNDFTNKITNRLLQDCDEEQKVGNQATIKKLDEQLPEVGTYKKTYKEHVQSVWIEFCRVQHYTKLNYQVAFTDASYRFYRKIFMIGDLFNTEQTFALVGYSTSDSTVKIHILKKLNHKFQPFFETTTKNPHTPGVPYHHIIDFMDYNGDKTKDLKVTTDFRMMHTAERSQLWIYQDNRLLFIPEYRNIVNGQYQAVDGKIYSYESIGCGDLHMLFKVYQWSRNKIILKQQIRCDCCAKKTCEVYINKKKEPIKTAKNVVYNFIPEFWHISMKRKLNIH